MGLRVHKWDREQLENIAKKLDSIAQELHDEKKTLIDSVIELSDEWKGRAGAAYIVVSAQKAANIESLIVNIENTAETLRKIINYYTDCENDVKKSVSRLV